MLNIKKGGGLMKKNVLALLVRLPPVIMRPGANHLAANKAALNSTPACRFDLGVD